MTPVSTLACFGLLLFLTPGIAFGMSNRSGDDADMLSWLMSQPLNVLFSFQAMVRGGLMLLMAATVLGLMP